MPVSAAKSEQEKITGLHHVQGEDSVLKSPTEFSVHTTITLSSMQHFNRPWRLLLLPTSNQRALLPIVQVDLLFSGSRQKIGNALLDSGAQISLIRTPIAEELRLKGKETVITITKVEGQEEELRTKTYQVRIRSLENHTRYTIQATGIPWITDEISKVRVDDIARKLDLNKKQLHRGFGTADLLIGIDQAKFHVGETKEAGDLVARHTPLGWVIFGATHDQNLQEYQVYHVKTTESMGVSVKPCSQVERKEAKIIEDSCKKGVTNG